MINHTQEKLMQYAIIHIADIHYKSNEPEGALNILDAFAIDIKKQKDMLKDYKFYLAITGDIIYSGADNDSYISFLKEFDSILNECGIDKNSRMIVPGNHDIDRSVVKNILTTENDQTNVCYDDETLFNNQIDMGMFHQSKFENYKIFESEFSNIGIDFSPPGKGWQVDEKFGVYCLNSAIGSYGGVSGKSDMGNLPIYTRGLFKWCRDKSTDLNVLLMHHPIDHLNNWSKNELTQLIENNFTLCLSGHNHEQKIYYNKISRNSLICSAPQLFTSKLDNLGYSIVILENNVVKELRYRQFINGTFFNGQRFSGSDDGIITIDSKEQKNIERLEKLLDNSLAFFKNQKKVFIKPKISKDREFNDTDNLIDSVIIKPNWYVVTAQPQFGLTSLSHYMRLESYKNGKFWIYLDARHLKSRNTLREIETQLQDFEKKVDDIQCIIVDSWDGSEIDHKNILKQLSEGFTETPLVVMSNYVEAYYNSTFDFHKINPNFTTVHLQALKRNKVRELVTKLNSLRDTETEDTLVSKIINDLDALNIHRTPLNCLTLIKVFENDFNGELFNRTKLIKAVLNILFADADSFTYATNKPDPDDCEFILGEFCRRLIEDRVRNFPVNDFHDQLKMICKQNLISIDTEILINILKENNILIRVGKDYYFKHSYWIYYFASVNMIHQQDFEKYILSNQCYVNFPEIIEFYTGQDGRRSEAIVTLTKDLIDLTETVYNKIGIHDKSNPLNGFLWNPTPSNIKQITDDLSDKVKRSKLPTVIKDHHADENYNSEAPYNQSINKIMTEYSVISLIQGINASSRALRNSNYVDTVLRKNLLSAIFNSWEQVSRVIFYLSPTLAKEGRASFDGMGFVLMGDFGESYREQLKSIFLANPININRYFKDSLSSKKIGPLVFDNLENNNSELQKLLIAHFLISERPTGWNGVVFEFMNMLHRNSFFLGNLFDSINLHIDKGFVSEEDLAKLKLLIKIVVAKHVGKNKLRKIADNMTINEINTLPIDKILAEKKGQKPKKIE